MSSICALSPSVRLEITKARLIAPLPLYHRKLNFYSVSMSLRFCETSSDFGWVIMFEGSKCEMNRRSFTAKGIVASGVSVMESTLTAKPAQG